MFKEVEQLKPDQVVQVQDNEKERRKECIASFPLLPGMRVWQKNLRTGEIKEAEYKTAPASYATEVHSDRQKDQVHYMPATAITRIIDAQPGFSYVRALNLTNAIRKFNGK